MYHNSIISYKSILKIFAAVQSFRFSPCLPLKILKKVRNNNNNNNNNNNKKKKKKKKKKEKKKNPYVFFFFYSYPTPTPWEALHQ